MDALEDLVQNFVHDLRTVGGLAPLHGTSSGHAEDGLPPPSANPAFAPVNAIGIAAGQNPSADAGQVGNGTTISEKTLSVQHKRKSKRTATEADRASNRRIISNELSTEEDDQSSEPRRALTVNEAVRLYSISRSSIYLLIKAGVLPNVVVAGRRLLPRDAMEALIR